ncbi:hypothetical protein MPSEU_000625000 [Mayamaea pseudoterrestris]|nr:hypothetical protein MPSEU_000625000 [Mayamaea pseudoterrestris]
MVPFTRTFRCTLLVTAWSLLPGSSVLAKPNNPQMQQSISSFLRSNQQRKLQNIVISYPDDDGDDQTESTTAPVASSGSERTTTTVVCQTVSDAASKRLDVTLQYSIETDTSDANLPLDYLNEIVPSLVVEEAITSVANDVCNVQAAKVANEEDDDDIVHDDTSASHSGSADKSALDESTPSNRRQLAVDSDCIISVSSGAPGKRVSTCTPSLADSVSCDVFEDSFSILHTGECNEDDILSESMDAIVQGIGSKDFLVSVNEETSESGVTVTLIELLESENGDNTGATGAGATTSQYSAKSTGMNVAGKSVVACLALVALFGMSTLYVHSRNQRLKNRNNDDKSVHTQWSNKTDDNSYLKPDWHDLLFRHSKMDVHKCKSVLCDVCQPNLGLVHTVRVPRGANVQSLQLEEAAAMPKDETPVADSPSTKSSNSRRSLEPLGDLEPITKEGAELPTDSEDDKPSRRFFGRSRKSNVTSRDFEELDMMCREISIPKHAADDDVISFVASSSSSQSVRSVYTTEKPKEILL